MSSSALLSTERHHYNPYGYLPSKAVCIIMIVLFGISTALHTGQAIYTRRWYLLCTAVLCGLAEVMGWAGRLWSAYNIFNGTPFMMQISTTILAPTFLAAAIFIILGTIIGILGPQYSRLRPRLYAIVFVSFDIFCLVIQAIGGGMASKEADSASGDATKGGHVMLVGIILQLVEMFVYAVLATEFFINYAHGKPVRDLSSSELASSSHHMDTLPHSTVDAERKANPAYRTTARMDRKVKLMILAMSFATICLFIRAIYRTAELSDGWTGRIIHTEVYFNVLDGAMIVLAMYTLNFVHPGFMLRAQTLK